MIKHYLSFFILVYSTIAAAQNYESGHPIDEALGECRLAVENQSAEAGIQCEYTARIAWEKEVDKYYGLLMKVLMPEAKKQFKTAHKNWVAYRDEEMAFAGALYKNMDGQAWLVVHAVRLTNIIRTRALELQEYHEMATFPD